MPIPLDKINDRERDMATWLRDNAPNVFDDQRHLDADTTERAYWHYGYLVALRDVRKLLAD